MMHVQLEIVKIIRDSEQAAGNRKMRNNLV